MPANKSPLEGYRKLGGGGAAGGLILGVLNADSLTDLVRVAAMAAVVLGYIAYVVGNVLEHRSKATRVPPCPDPEASDA